MKSGRNGTVGTRAIDWAEYKSPEGRSYYYNKITKKRTWTKPQVLVEHEYANRSKCFWKEFFDKDRNRYYYFNEDTGESVWTKPQELIDYEKRQASIKRNEVTQKLSIEQFNILLEESCTDSTEDWPTVQKRMVHDERYRNIDSIELKKDLFYRFLSVLRQREREARRKREEKFKNRFFELLRSVEGQVRYLSFPSFLNTVEPLLQKLPDNEVLQKLSGYAKLDHYEEFIGNYQKECRRSEATAKARLKKEIYNVFMMKHKQGFLTPKTLWRDFKNSDHLMNNQEYLRIIGHGMTQPENVKKTNFTLSPFEAMQVWSDFSRDLEDETRRNAKRELERQNLERRNNRIGYWRVLSQLEQASQFDVDSEWKNDVQKLVEDTDEYKNIMKSRDEIYRKIEEENFYPTSEVEVFSRRRRRKRRGGRSADRSSRILPLSSSKKNKHIQYNDEKVEILDTFMNDHVDGLIGPKELFYEFVDEMEIVYQKDCKSIKQMMERNKIRIGVNTSTEDFEKQVNEVMMKEVQQQNNNNTILPPPPTPEIKDLRNLKIYHKHSLIRQRKKLVKKLKNDILRPHRELVIEHESLEEYIATVSKIVPSHQNEEQVKMFREEIKPNFSDDETFLQGVYDKYREKVIKKKERRMKKKRKRKESDDLLGVSSSIDNSNILEVKEPFSKKRKLSDDGAKEGPNIIHRPLLPPRERQRKVYDPFEYELNKYKRNKRKF